MEHENGLLQVVLEHRCTSTIQVGSVTVHLMPHRLLRSRVSDLHMTDQHTIVSDVLDGPGGPVAFRQVRAPRDSGHGSVPGRYRCICPWCVADLGQIPAYDYGTLYNKLVERQRPHMEKCPARNEVRMKVRRPDGTLGFLQGRYG